MMVVEWKDTGLLSCPTIVSRTVFLLHQQLLPDSAFVHSCLTMCHVTRVIKHKLNEEKKSFKQEKQNYDCSCIMITFVSSHPIHGVSLVMRCAFTTYYQPTN